MAKAGLGQMQDAAAAFAKAASLDPTNFVHPLFLGVAYLDSGDTHGALREFGRAGRLAPDNPLVKGYVALANWALNGQGSVDALLEHVDQLGPAFAARLLLRVTERVLSDRGPSVCVTLLGPSHEAPGALATEAKSARWERRWQAWRIRRLVSRGAYEEAVRRSWLHPEALGEGGLAESLVEARRQAVAQLRGEVAKMSAADLPNARRERALRDMLLRLAEMESVSGNATEMYGALGQWWDSFLRSGKPRRASQLASELLLRMAKIEVERGDYVKAIESCSNARALWATPEGHWLDAIAQLGVGKRNQACFQLEDFLRASDRRIGRRVGPYVREAAQATGMS
jgi:tetratricopeptide (TPR) repeat protein